MDFSIQYLSFFVIQAEDAGGQADKRCKHYQTLGREEYEESELKPFLDGEFTRTAKRKVERNPNTENAPTKIGRFVVEPGYDAGSNPNYNMFQRIRFAESKEEFLGHCDELARSYMETPAVRGGALIVASAKLNAYFDEPFVFVMKCDFEPKIARISDEKTLISQVDMAISARNMKSIQYPHMPEPGMLEEEELKIHQASHARYFEDFLSYVSYEKALPEIMNEHVVTMVHQYMETQYEGQPEEERTLEDRREQQERVEAWAATEKRERLQETWGHEQVMEAASVLVEHKPDVELKFKLDGVGIRALLSDYGDKIHLARLGDRYVVLIEGETFQFEKGVSPVELLQPEELESVLQRIAEKPGRTAENAERADETPPWE
ncbi:hypothetical protein J31TS4_30920 [Paenibacillus sp. J31TS4]|uniref:DUF3900 domain-containing protein n=1 Tax=Paenibacillus sp. J31TS4 TaxID=2807195 RepID=UPI001B0E028C|nr:DUF3900 domain-containing protein [Paenibacillus sp. J31TS4]GIP39812.1 hypothetical protein J31TS4_30920 [Paenibacillus sp. J31TS4]